jgi:uncharacterized membrane protein YphA (DoxX/SURF4 family)
MNQSIAINIMLIMFFLSGISKIRNFKTVSRDFVTKVPFKIPIELAYICILCAIVIQILSPILINVGLIKKNKRLIFYSTLSIIIFTILATLLYHFPPTGYQYYPFMSNVTIIGGFLLIITYNMDIKLI